MAGTTEQLVEVVVRLSLAREIEESLATTALGQLDATQRAQQEMPPIAIGIMTRIVRPAPPAKPLLMAIRQRLEQTIKDYPIEEPPESAK